MREIESMKSSNRAKFEGAKEKCAKLGTQLQLLTSLHQEISANLQD
jgi:hypothetical protein